MPGPGPGRAGRLHIKIAALLFFMALASLLAYHAHVGAESLCSAYQEPVSDHFDGEFFFNPVSSATPPVNPGEEPKRKEFGWFWLRYAFGINMQEWPKAADIVPGKPPAPRAPKGSIVITPVGHGTFLIQMDGVNILTDPIWSDRCSPVYWAGPKRYRAPGIRFEDLPPVNVVLVSHNHYDHLDVPTLKRLSGKGVRRSITTLGNRGLICDAGIPVVDEVDWWQSLRISENVTVAVVPARHFSSRTLWDRNRTLWGGFVVSGPSGNVYYSGDTGYGPPFPGDSKEVLACPGGTPAHLAFLAEKCRQTPTPEFQRRPHGTC